MIIMMISIMEWSVKSVTLYSKLSHSICNIHKMLLWLTVIFIQVSLFIKMMTNDEFKVG